MTIRPLNLTDLKASISDAHDRGEKVTGIELGALDRILAHSPEDMTVTVESGITLARLQPELARRSQWLPIDPPNPGNLTVGALLAINASGPRRYGCGMIRDHLIGIKIVLADGRLVKSGGKVVKNVAGYDLARLFIGSHGSLGVIVEATFKLRPLPEVEQFVRLRCGSMENAARLIESVIESEVTPIVLDVHNVGCGDSPQSGAAFVVVGFAGTREEVDWQMARTGELGLDEPSTLDYEQSFWSGDVLPRRLSVRPSCIAEALRELAGAPFVARAGNGVIYHRGMFPPAESEVPVALMRRVKETFDPKHIFPELPL